MLTLTNTLPFERMLNDFFGQPAERRGLIPALDVVQTADAYVVSVELPGVGPDGIDVTVVDDRLEIRAEKTVAHEEKKEDRLRLERRVGTYQRTLTLPGAVDATKVAAESKDGVLTITLPKREEARARKVAVNVS